MIAVAYPYEVMRSLVRALKPGGQVVLVEDRCEDPDVPIKTLCKMSEVQVRREMGLLPLACRGSRSTTLEGFLGRS
jgi:hypothetical protein